MRRLLILLLCTLTMFMSLTGPAESHHRPGPCSIHWQRAWKDHRDVEPVKRLIRCAATRFGISPDKAIAVASCETGGTFSPDAGVGDADPYRGVFQHHRDYWPGRVSLYTERRWQLWTWIRNARTQAIVTARMVRAQGWGAWSCA